MGGRLLTTKYSIYTEFNGRKYLQKSLDFFSLLYGNKTTEKPLRQHFKPYVKINNPFNCNGKEINELKEVTYHMKKENGLNYFELDYPMKYSDMVKTVKLDSIVLHHTGNSYALPELLERHMNFFSAIGYHYIIQEDGSIVNTRPLEYQGAHVGGDTNKGKIGISFCMNLNFYKPDIKMNESYNRLIEYLTEKYDIDKTNVFLHREVQIKKINEFLNRKGFGENYLDKNILSIINSKEDFKRKKKQVVEKILRNNLDIDTSQEISEMIKKLTTCPGIYFNLKMGGEFGRLRKVS